MTVAGAGGVAGCPMPCEMHQRQAGRGKGWNRMKGAPYNRPAGPAVVSATSDDSRVGARHIVAADSPSRFIAGAAPS